MFLPDYIFQCFLLLKEKKKKETTIPSKSLESSTRRLPSPSWLSVFLYSCLAPFSLCKLFLSSLRTNLQLSLQLLCYKYMYKHMLTANKVFYA